MPSTNSAGTPLLQGKLLPQSTSFWSIPREARDTIYKTYFQGHVTIKTSIPANKHTALDAIPPRLLLLNRQVYDEAMSAYYSHTTFVFDSDPFNHIRQWLLRIGDENARLVQHICAVPSGMYPIRPRYYQSPFEGLRFYNFCNSGPIAQNYLAKLSKELNLRQGILIVKLQADYAAPETPASQQVMQQAHANSQPGFDGVVWTSTPPEELRSLFPFMADSENQDDDDSDEMYEE